MSALQSACIIRTFRMTHRLQISLCERSELILNQLLFLVWKISVKYRKFSLGKRETRVIHIFQKSFPFLFVISTSVITSPMINEVKRTSQVGKKALLVFTFIMLLLQYWKVLFMMWNQCFGILIFQLRFGKMSLGGGVFHFNQDFLLVSVWGRGWSRSSTASF